MANDFSAWTQKSTKWIFGSIIAVMAISLTISFGSGGIGGCGSSQGNREAGTVFDRKVTETEYLRAHRRALAYHRWTAIHSFGNPGLFINYAMRTGQFIGAQDPKEDELNKKAFEMLALRHYATMCGLAVSEEEIAGKITSLCAGANIPTAPIDMEKYERMVGIVFASTVTDFEQLVPDMLLIDKAIELAVETPSVDFRGVLEGLGKENRELRALVASIDPEQFLKEMRQPGPEEILSYYEKSKAKFQVPEKYQVEFLLADVEKIKEKLAEPTEEEMKKFYDDNKALYTEGGGHSEDDGHDHEGPVPQGRTKPYDEVKEEVRKQVKTRKAQRTAFETMQKVNAALGDKIKKLRDEVSKDVDADSQWKDKPQSERDLETRKRVNEKSGSFFNELVKEFEMSGVALTNDITIRFTEKQTEEVENRAGKPTDSFRVVDFVKAQQVGVFSPLAKTEKGSVIYRLNAKEAAHEAGLSDAVKRQIIRAMAADKLKERAGKAADELAKRITGAADLEPNPHKKNAAKLAAVAKICEQEPDLFKRTNYFKASQSGAMGLGDASIEQAVKNALTGNPEQIAAGHAVAIRGSSVGGEKGDWGFVAVVEDVVQGAPDDANFWAKVQEAEDREKTKRRDQQVKSIVLLAAIVDKSKELKNRPADDN
jgi:hypothetical protein